MLANLPIFWYICHMLLKDKSAKLELILSVLAHYTTRVPSVVPPLAGISGGQEVLGLPPNELTMSRRRSNAREDARSLLLTVDSASDPLSNLVIGLTFYEDWYSTIPKEMQLKNIAVETSMPMDLETVGYKGANAASRGNINMPVVDQRIHGHGGYAAEWVVEMIGLHLQATYPDHKTWWEFASCLLKLSRCEEDGASMCVDGDEVDRIESDIRISRIPVMLKGKSGMTWKLRCKWWLNSHFSKNILASEISAGDLKLIACKAACATHLYGETFEYFAKVKTDLEGHDDKTLLTFLHMHTKSSIGFYSKFIRKLMALQFRQPFILNFAVTSNFNVSISVAMMS